VDVPQCLSCGTCCFSTLETYVRVTGDDYARLDDRAEALTTWIGHRAYMRIIDGRCAALRVDLRMRRFVCDVYETRPQTCRDLARGSPECLGERVMKLERSRRATG
jgi:Fe-S-cluster containining protein